MQLNHCLLLHELRYALQEATTNGAIVGSHPGLGQGLAVAALHMLGMIVCFPLNSLTLLKVYKGKSGHVTPLLFCANLQRIPVFNGAYY